MKEVRDISQIDYGNRVTIKNPADEEFCLNIKKNTNARICVGRAGTGYRTENYLRYLADHAGGGVGSTGLQQGPESVGAWMECRGICAAFHAHLYLRPAVFPHCRLSRTGQYAKHSDASYSDAAHGIHGQ